MKKILSLLVMLFFSAITVQAGTLSLSTYYPSRYGEYSQIRMMPVDTSINPIVCDDQSKGLIYYDGTSGDMVVCGDVSSEALLVWRFEDPIIHPIDTSDDLNVGMGDSHPDALLEVSASGTANPLLYLSSDDDANGDLMSVLSSHNLGLGSVVPPFRLTIDQDRAGSADGGILSFGTFGGGNSLTVSGAGTRMFWYPRKAAFRAGSVTLDQWDNVNIGDYSVALGYDVLASGTSSVAIGSNNSASADYSVAIGDFNGSVNANAVSIGYSLINDGVASVAIGIDNQINDPSTGAVVLGNQNQVIGDSSIVMGEGSVSLFSVASVAMGYQCGAFGLTSIAMGYNAQAAESYSTSIGYNTLADEILAVAMGDSTSANAFNSFAIGKENIANGQLSFAFNNNTTAQSYLSAVFGQFNVVSGTTDSWVDTEPVFVVGNGSDNLNRSNALTILKNGQTIIGGDASEGYKLRVYGGDAAVDAGFGWKTDSDRRLKKDIAPIENALEKLSGLRAVEYNTLDESDDTQKHLGLIAQELELAFPELVTTDDDGYKSVDYSKFSSVLIEAVKELKFKNDQLKMRIKTIKDQINSFEN